jgi:hypothetical protein
VAQFFLRASGSEFVLVDEQYGILTVSRWQDDSQGLDPFVAIERDFKRAIQNDLGRQLIEDVLLLGSLRRPIDTAELRAYFLQTRDSRKCHPFGFAQTARLFGITIRWQASGNRS